MDKKENELPIIKPTIKVRKEFIEKQRNFISKNAISSIFFNKKNQKRNDSPTIKEKKEVKEERMNLLNLVKIIIGWIISLPIMLLLLPFTILVTVFVFIPVFILYTRQQKTLRRKIDSIKSEN